MDNSATASPEGVYRTSGSFPNLPTRITLFTLLASIDSLLFIFVDYRKNYNRNYFWDNQLLNYYFFNKLLYRTLFLIFQNDADILRIFPIYPQPIYKHAPR